MSTKPTGGPAFPVSLPHSDEGMTLRDFFMASAIQNSAICTGISNDRQIDLWFGTTNITRQQIASKQAALCADAMLAERDK